MTIQKKLYSSLGALAAGALLMAGSSLYMLGRLSDALMESNSRTAVKLDLVNAGRARYWEVLASLRGVFMFHMLKDVSSAEASARQAEAALGRLKEQIGQIRPLLVTEEGRRQLATLELAANEMQGLINEYVRLIREDRQEQFASDIAPKVRLVMGKAETALNTLRDQQRQFLTEATEAGESLRRSSMILSICLASLLMVIAAIAFFIVRRIGRYLSGIVLALTEGAQQVASAASQVSSSSQALAQGASEQAAAIEQTLASSEEILSLSKRNGDGARTASTLVATSQGKFQQADLALAEAVQAMTETNAQSDRISKIIRTIDEIAFQTNILALNASVEAARAGEAGMGFAVVADEVRSLAQRCAQAAKDTTTLIEESIAKMQDGKVKVDQVAAVMRAITGEAARVKTVVDEVRLAAEEQERGMEQISRAILQMQQVTQQVAASAEEGASASEELHAQSQSLRDIIRRLQALVAERTA